MDNSSVRARLLASSDRESLLNSSSIAGYNNPFHKQKQLGNYFSDKIFLVDEWHSEEYLNPYDDSKNGDATWRLKERMKTAGVALVVCLNIGIDPPDIVRPNPSARKECWFDPIGPKQKGLEFIGNALQQQYEKWQPKAKYKQCLDPTSEELRRVCMNLRKNSRGDRLLLHYNGHGVPRPTKNGELWVFGKHYTHYTPVAICELRTWLGDPAIYVLDCSGAGVLINHLVDNMSMKQQHNMSPIGFDLNSGGLSRPGSTAPGTTPLSGVSGGPSEGSTIVLAACKANEILPLNPQYPADIFTACLTTPIVIAMRWFILQNPYSMRDINPDIAENLPGKDNDRKTPRGELNWIFTAITDTIAWNTLPSKIFQKMFRQDLLVASLFRNFLLAKRIMKSLGCTPQSWPQLPDSTTHPLWQSWDLTLESFIMYNNSLAKGSMMVDPRNNMSFNGVGGGAAAGVGPDGRSLALSGGGGGGGGMMGSGGVGSNNATLAAVAAASNLSFFTDQLTAFELWLDFGSVNSEPPSHLPIVLQVLLSQTHRLRALLLLKRYLALGSEAVNLSLLVGIFPYILKLLQSPADDIKQILVSIWASIIGFDSSCRQELVREKAQPYFVQYLIASGMPPAHRCLAAFVLSEICSNYREGQQTCLQLGLHRSCTSILGQPDVLASGSLKRWVCLCLYKLCEDFLWAKYLCITEAGHTFLYPLLYDSDPTVRAAAVLALGEIFGASALNTSQASAGGGNSTPKRSGAPSGMEDGRPKPSMEEKDLRETELQLAQQILECCMDGAVVVRVEAVFALSKFFIQPAHLDCLKIVAKAVCKRNYDKSALQQVKQERKSISPSVDKINFLYPWHLTPTEHRDICALVENFLEGKVAAGSTTTAGQTALRPGSPPHVPYQMGASMSLFEEPRKAQQQQQPTTGGGTVPEVAPVPNRGRLMSKDSTDTAGTAGNPSTPALSNLMAGAYVKLWLALTEVQGKDPCHTVSSAAGTIRNRVVALIAMDEKKAQYERQIIESGGQLVNQSAPQLNPLTIATPESTAFLNSFSSSYAVSPYASSSYLMDPRDGSSGSGGGLTLGGPPGSASAGGGSGSGSDGYTSAMLSPLGVVGSNTNPFGSPSSRHKNIKTGSKLPKSSPFLLNGQQQQQQMIVQAGTNTDYSFSTPTAADRPSASGAGGSGSKQDVNLLRQSLSSSTSQPNLSASEAKSLRLSSLSPFGGSSTNATKSSSNLQAYGNHHSSGASDQHHHQHHANKGQKQQQHQRHPYLASWMDESVKELLDLNEEDLLVSFTSNYYEMTKRIFLEPDLGFDPYTDPLSTEGKSRTYRNSKQLEIVAHEAYLQSVFKDIDDRSDSFLIAEQSRNNKTGGGSNSSSHGNKAAANAGLDEAQSARSALVNALSPQVSRFEQKALLNIENAMMTSLVMFHAFQDVLAVCDGSTVGIWSLNTCSRIMEIKNRSHSSATPQPTVATGNGRRSPFQYNEPPSIFTPMAAARITTMAWINESYDALLLLGSDDGIIKVWRDTSSSDTIAAHNNGGGGGGSGGGGSGTIERTSSVRDSLNNVSVNQTSTCELASTFAALPDVSETSRGSGIVISWRQASGTLCVGGNSSSIRLWDLGREQCIRSFNSGSDTCLTAMASTAVPGKFSTNSNNPADYQQSSMPSGDNGEAPQMSWIFAGFADGSIGCFDERVYTNGGRIHSARDHSAWIISAHLRADIPEVITASVRGSVKFWDLRTMRTYKTLEVQKSPLTALAVHNCAPIMATGSHAQFIKILTLGGEQLGNIIKYHDGFLGQRIGPVSCLAFHPHRMLLAASSTDSIVSIYSTADNNLNT